MSDGVYRTSANEARERCGACARMVDREELSVRADGTSVCPMCVEPEPVSTAPTHVAHVRCGRCLKTVPIEKTFVRWIGSKVCAACEEEIRYNLSWGTTGIRGEARGPMLVAGLGLGIFFMLLMTIMGR